MERASQLAARWRATTTGDRKKIVPQRGISWKSVRGEPACSCCMGHAVHNAHHNNGIPSKNRLRTKERKKKTKKSAQLTDYHELIFTRSMVPENSQNQMALHKTQTNSRKSTAEKSLSKKSIMSTARVHASPMTKNDDIDKMIQPLLHAALWFISCLSSNRAWGKTSQECVQQKANTPTPHTHLQQQLTRIGTTSYLGSAKIAITNRPTDQPRAQKRKSRERDGELHQFNRFKLVVDWCVVDDDHFGMHECVEAWDGVERWSKLGGEEHLHARTAHDARGVPNSVLWFNVPSLRVVWESRAHQGPCASCGASLWVECSPR